MSTDLSGQRLGHYQVEGVLGHGGMSVVYRAVDERLGRAVALKVMSENLSADPEFRTRFVGEARAASAIDHVNVVPLYEFGDADGHLFIAMRLVDGTDLARELAQGPLASRRALQLLGQVGAALDMLHQHGLVHLDVKPANVLMTRNELAGTEHVYLADFGLTRGDGSGHRTRTGDFLGSPTYASPEHLRGQALDASTDEYSLTCMLFAALAGRPPVRGRRPDGHHRAAHRNGAFAVGAHRAAADHRSGDRPGDGPRPGAALPDQCRPARSSQAGLVHRGGTAPARTHGADSAARGRPAHRTDVRPRPAAATTHTTADATAAVGVGAAPSGQPP